jgi:hypothetical protein
MRVAEKLSWKGLMSSGSKKGTQIYYILFCLKVTATKSPLLALLNPEDDETLIL